MAELIQKKDKHLEIQAKKVKRKYLVHKVECVNCGSLSEYTSRDTDKDGSVTCMNANCNHKVKTAWGDDEKLVDKGGYEPGN